jgi:hypothetical protein
MMPSTGAGQLAGPRSASAPANPDSLLVSRDLNKYLFVEVAADPVTQTTR